MKLWRLLDKLFYLIHLAVVAFILCGWIFPQTRLAHLIFILLTLASWRVLGLWMGQGYCPLTSWHWKVKAELGQVAPEGPFIHSLAERAFKRPLSVKGVNLAVELLTVSLALLSLGLNLQGYLAR